MKSQKFKFDPLFNVSFVWKNKFHLKVGSVRSKNRLQISQSLIHMSHETIRNRFSGSKKEFTPEELDYLTHLDGYNHYAIGIEEDSPRHLGIGVARIVRSIKTPDEAEIAIALIDEYQKIGLGKLLLKLIIFAATERNIRFLSFTYLPNNDAIINLIKSFHHQIEQRRFHDYVQVKLDLNSIDLEMLRSELKKDLPELHL